MLTQDNKLLLASTAGLSALQAASSGSPSGWLNGTYWAANLSTAGNHYTVDLSSSAAIGAAADTATNYAAFQLVDGAPAIKFVTDSGSSATDNYTNQPLVQVTNIPQAYYWQWRIVSHSTLGTTSWSTLQQYAVASQFSLPTDNTLNNGLVFPQSTIEVRVFRDAAGTDPYMVSGYNKTQWTVDTVGENVNNVVVIDSLLDSSSDPGLDVALGYQGTLSTGITSNDNLPTVKGRITSFAPGSDASNTKVNLYAVNSTTLLKSLVGTFDIVHNSITGQDEWQGRLATSLGSGCKDVSLSVEAVSADTAGNATGTTTSASFSYTLDTNAPPPPSIGNVLDDVGQVGGTALSTATSVAANGWTNDSTPTVRVNLDQTGATGTKLVANDYLRLYDAGTPIGNVYRLTAADLSAGYVNLSVSSLTDGVHTLTAKVYDQVGNLSSSSSDYVINVQTAAPVPTIRVLDDVGMYQTDITTSGQSTDDTSPTVRVSLSASLHVGEVVEVFRDDSSFTGSSVTLTAAHLAAGYVDIPTTGLVNGTSYSFTARFTDLAGNIGSKCSPLSLTVDTVAPSQLPTLTRAQDDVSLIVGTVPATEATRIGVALTRSLRSGQVEAVT